MEKKNERNDELIKKLRAESRDNMVKLYGDREFTPEKRKELIQHLEELCMKLNDVQRCVDDVHKLLPTEYDIENFDKMLAEMGDRARFRSMSMQLDVAIKRAAEYLKRLKMEVNEDDGSSG